MGDDVKGPSFIRQQTKTEVIVKIECAEGAPFMGTSKETDLKCDVRKGGLRKEFSTDVDKDLETSLNQDGVDEEFITGDLDQSDDDDDVPLPHPPPKQARTPKMKSTDLGSSSLEQKHTHKCPDCPFSSDTPAYFKSHLTLHKKGSTSIICEECNWHVHPSRMVHHLKTRHAPKESPTANGSKMLELDTSNPFHLTYYSAHKKRTIHKCRRCPFQSKDSKVVEIHSEVHKKGSIAVACKDCGVYVFSHKLSKHRGSCQKKRLRESHTSASVPVVINCSITR